MLIWGMYIYTYERKWLEYIKREWYVGYLES